MGLFRLHKLNVFLLITLVGFIGLSVLWLSTAIAAEDKAPEQVKKTSESGSTDPNLPHSPDTTTNEPAPPTATSKTSPDPNNPSVENENNDETDIFELDLSSLDIINETYRNIFTSELISEDGQVKYSTLKRKPLDRLVAKRELKDLNPAILMNLSREERIAFWINTYNFCTLQVILENYPIQPKWWNIIYPDNSIMQITGAWEKVFFEIQREEYTLQEIEQNFLLQRYKDPRICFALSNACISRAILRNEPYEGNRLHEQLDDQVKKYLATDKGLSLDKNNNILNLSNLFQVHKNTFLASKYAEIKKFRNRKDEERIWLNFILPHLPQEDVSYLETAAFKIKFIEDDWHLNEAP